MTGLMENVKTINSAVRTVVVLFCMGGLGFGGWFGYENYLKPGIEAKTAMADLDALQKEFDQQQTAYKELQTEFDDQQRVLDDTRQDLVRTRKEKEKIATSLKLMKVDRRLANVRVIDTFEKDDQPHMRVEFVEVDEAGKFIGEPRQFELKGTLFYVDCWVVSFLDHYIEGADALRSCSLCVFKGIYGNEDTPASGHALDQTSQSDVPGIYGVPGKTEFEQQIWSNFWKVCNNPDEQEKLGIRTSHGQAIYVRAEKGKVYQVNVRSSGGISLNPLAGDGSE